MNTNTIYEIINVEASWNISPSFLFPISDYIKKIIVSYSSFEELENFILNNSNFINYATIGVNIEGYDIYEKDLGKISKTKKVIIFLGSRLNLEELESIKEIVGNRCFNLFTFTLNNQKAIPKKRKFN